MNWKDVANKFKSKIKRATCVAIFCHINPDGDTLGCALSIHFALKKLNINSRVFCDDSIPTKLQWLNGVSLVEKFSSFEGFDLAIAVDCADSSRIGKAAVLFENFASTIAIDHHITHTHFAKFGIVDSTASACAEIIYRLLNEMNLLDSNIATLLFAALVSDNGCFAFSSTTAESHSIASKLYDFDIDASQIIYNIWKKKNYGVFLLSSRALYGCKFFYDNKIAIITFNSKDFKETNTNESDTEGIITNVIDVDSVEIAFALSEIARYSYKVSIRTKNNINAAECALQFGGGGHERAAGCRVQGCYEDVIEKLIKAATDRLP